MAQKESIDLHELFSPVAHNYKLYRPDYPPELFSFLSSLSPNKTHAWDCGTGNGQAALSLAEHFKQVTACDVNQEQIKLAKVHPRIRYLLGSVDYSGLDTDSIDLVTVAEALHWFDIQAFFLEVRRVLCPGGVLAVWNYDRCLIEPDIDQLLDQYRDRILGLYWSKSALSADVRIYDIPFCEVPVPNLEIIANWDMSHIIGYLGSWSATNAYQRCNGVNPVQFIHQDLMTLWGNPSTSKIVRWPLNIRAGYF